MIPFNCNFSWCLINSSFARLHEIMNIFLNHIQLYLRVGTFHFSLPLLLVPLRLLMPCCYQCCHVMGTTTVPRDSTLRHPTVPRASDCMCCHDSQSLSGLRCWHCFCSHRLQAPLILLPAPKPWLWAPCWEGWVCNHYWCWGWGGPGSWVVSWFLEPPVSGTTSVPGAFDLGFQWGSLNL